jgi:hypothetical protein
MHTGSPKGVTLLELEAVGEEIPEEIPPQVGTRGEEQEQKDLLECLDHKPTNFIKGKPQSIIRLP